MALGQGGPRFSCVCTSLSRQFASIPYVLYVFPGRTKWRGYFLPRAPELGGKLRLQARLQMP